MGPILAGLGFVFGVVVSIAEGQNILRALLNGVIFSAIFWGVGWWLNARKNSL